MTGDTVVVWHYCQLRQLSVMADDRRHCCCWHLTSAAANNTIAKLSFIGWYFNKQLLISHNTVSSITKSNNIILEFSKLTNITNMNVVEWFMQPWFRESTLSNKQTITKMNQRDTHKALIINKLQHAIAHLWWIRTNGKQRLNQKVSNQISHKCSYIQESYYVALRDLRVHQWAEPTCSVARWRSLGTLSLCCRR